jgi:hypothetical protein
MAEFTLLGKLFKNHLLFFMCGGGGGVSLLFWVKVGIFHCSISKL